MTAEERRHERHRRYAVAIDLMTGSTDSLGINHSMLYSNEWGGRLIRDGLEVGVAMLEDRHARFHEQGICEPSPGYPW